MTLAGVRGSVEARHCVALALLLAGAGCDSTGHGQQRASSPSASPSATTEPARAAAGAPGAELRRLEPCVPLNYEECFNALDD
ncbi:MAG TPA: hypothetical protein VJU61_03170, partial [Polyangiaceae bacterium]|nr:hypothetical protein [Polyangiaceae bacterium]